MYLITLLSLPCRLLRSLVLPLHAVPDGRRPRLVLRYAAAGRLLRGVLPAPLLHQRAPQHPRKARGNHEVLAARSEA